MRRSIFLAGVFSVLLVNCDQSPLAPAVNSPAAKKFHDSNHLYAVGTGGTPCYFDGNGDYNGLPGWYALTGTGTGWPAGTIGMTITQDCIGWDKDPWVVSSDGKIWRFCPNHSPKWWNQNLPSGKYAKDISAVGNMGGEVLACAVTTTGAIYYCTGNGSTYSAWSQITAVTNASKIDIDYQNWDIWVITTSNSIKRITYGTWAVLTTNPLISGTPKSIGCGNNCVFVCNNANELSTWYFATNTWPGWSPQPPYGASTVDVDYYGTPYVISSVPSQLGRIYKEIGSDWVSVSEIPPGGGGISVYAKDVSSA